jgi:hypothetical protein
MQGQQVPMGSLSTFTGPKAGAYQTSDMARVTGLSTFLASSAAGKSGTEIVKLLKSLGIPGSGPKGEYTAQDVLAAQTEGQNEAFWSNFLRGEATSMPEYLGGPDYPVPTYVGPDYSGYDYGGNEYP